MKVLTVFGIRPEAIKMAPVVKALAGKFPGCITVAEPHIESLPDVLENRCAAMMGPQESIDWADVIVAFAGHNQFKSICFDHVDGKRFVDVAGIRKNDA